MSSTENNGPRLNRFLCHLGRSLNVNSCRCVARLCFFSLCGSFSNFFTTIIYSRLNLSFFLFVFLFVVFSSLLSLTAVSYNCLPLSNRTWTISYRPYAYYKEVKEKCFVFLFFPLISFMYFWGNYGKPEGVRSELAIFNRLFFYSFHRCCKINLVTRSSSFIKDNDRVIGDLVHPYTDQNQ